MSKLSFFGSLILVMVTTACGSKVVIPDAVPDADTPDSEMTIDDEGGTPDAGFLVVTPQMQTITIKDGQGPTQAFTATMDGKPVPATWSVDHGEIGDIDANGVFTAKGKIGGVLIVTATYQGITGTAPLTVMVEVTQNGGNEGPGGVGGEGTGKAVTQQTINVLNGSPTADSTLNLLYPYDGTIWPRGLLAPLAQWSPGAQGDYDAVYIHAHEKFYDFKGWFGKTATPFAHHPIPKDAWTQMTYSNAGEDLVVDIVLAKGNVAYGPITQKWKVAQGSLRGTVYYNSYGTNLASSRAASLAIKHGATQPALVTTANECRDCHRVSSDGAWMQTQIGGDVVDATTVRIDLKNGYKESVMMPTNGRYAWAAMSHDGKLAFTHTSNTNNYGSGQGWPGGLVGAIDQTSGLYSMPSGNPVGTGIPQGLKAATPTFSDDTRHVAFNLFGMDKRSLGALDFDPKTNTFSTPQGGMVLFTPPGNQQIAGWPAYLPTNDALVFHLETKYNGRDFLGTRASCDGCDDGAHAEIWWLDVKSKKAARLDKLNGKGYLPTGPNGHADDTQLNYEPTISPVVSGGYAWVVFTSRRLYGNVATMNPYWSDWRFHDLTQSPTTDKIWIAAIDLNAPAGTDPSHPAFYVPAQELFAGNSRGYWASDPCKADGTSCETGDECCGGYCQSSNGQLICSPTKPMCAKEYDKCDTDGDCCKGLICINNRCAIIPPK